MKCLVKNCKNLFNDIEFRGDLCLPCYRELTTGEKNWVGLTGEEKYKLYCSPMPLMALIEEIEYKLKEKNCN